jgi:predicted nucleic acid-binding protein
VIFIDTSAIYALADRNDPFHDLAKERFEALISARESLLTHNYVLVESMALLQHRLGVDAALKLDESRGAFEIEWVDEKTHLEAVRRLRSLARRKHSFVNHVSFVVMRSRGVKTAFAFDKDFELEGFRLYGS